MKLDDLRLEPEVHSVFSEIEERILASKYLPPKEQINIAFSAGNYVNTILKEFINSGRYDYTYLSKQFADGKAYILEQVLNSI
ncbi:MAG TPA: hypothetical protein VJC39_02930 [Candidatus Nanoarchaeia archaeon]|nr:hypothetical protein [Candidatus Nanoarchaeia archaeon]